MIINPKTLIFLDLDGPMIPSRHHPLVDPYIIPRDEFPFLSTFSDTAKSLVRSIVDEFHGAIVTCSTHNMDTPGRTGKFHVMDLFERNGMADLLFDGDFRVPWQEMTAVGRAKAIMRWRKMHPDLIEIPYVCFDDDNTDYDRFKAEGNSIPYVMTGQNGIVASDAQKARIFLQEQIAGGV